MTISTLFKIAEKKMIFLVMVLSSLTGFSQNVSINSTGAAPNASAGLDIDFPNRGLLIPRVALTGTASFAPLPAHVAGMIVYNTATTADVVPGFYYDNGTRWISGFPMGNTAGDMLYWNGTNWVLLPAGAPGQFLQISGSNLPAWTGSASIGISTTAASAITSNTASSGGTILNANGTTIITRGVCFSTTSGPSTLNTTIVGSAASPYVVTLSPLVAGTIYYAKAYAVNNLSTSYGNEVIFSTLPTLSTNAATLVTVNTARSGGSVTTGNAPVIERGICYGTAANPTTASTKIIDPAPGAGAFVSDLTGLTENTLYHVRSYAINAGGTAYGADITFTTLSTLTTAAITAITSITATGGGTIAAGGNAVISSRGICWSTTAGPTTALATKTNNGTGTGAFVSNMTGLVGAQTYYVRAYAINAGGTSYGNELSFSTTGSVAPTVASTMAVTNIKSTTASSGGSITTDGGSAITHKGVCWGTSASPVLGTGNFTDDGTGTTPFGSSITGLTASTQYYVRAYATNAIGTGYGPTDVIFTTCGTPYYTVGQAAEGGIVFYVDCTGQSGLVAAAADQGSGVPWGCQGTVTGATGTAIYDGAANTTAILAACTTAGIAAQVCHAYTDGVYNDWYLPSSGELQEMYNNFGLLNLTSGLMTYWSSTESSATVAGGFFVNNGNGYAQAAMKGFGTQMVVRAIRKWTAPAALAPTLTTTPVSTISATDYNTGGTISSDGGSPVTACGVVWSTSPAPTIALPTKTNDFALLSFGMFTSSITGLAPATYHIRAYATNIAGTSYGNEITIVAGSVVIPTINTDPIINLIGAIAEGGGTPLTDGGDPLGISAMGVCWGPAADPTILDSKTNDGAGLYSFFSTITGLTVGNTYHVRAYATNTAGTGYGSDVSFVATAATLGQVVTGGWLPNGNIFYVDGTGTHGLVGLTFSNSPADWGCTSSVTGATGTAVFTGAANTAAIVTDINNNGCVSADPYGTFAAPLTQVNLGVYLPSKDEMNWLWTNLGASGLGAYITPGLYWSSSEVDATHAWYLDATAAPTWVSTGTNALKTAQYNAWPIWSF